MSRPRTAYGQARRAAQTWTDAQVAVFQHPASEHKRVLANWTRICHSAGLTSVSTDWSDGWRGQTVRINLMVAPEDAAQAIAADARKVNNQLRSAAVLLWLCELVCRPAKVRRLRHSPYNARDCRAQMLDADEVVQRVDLLWWVYRYCCALNYLYENRKGTTHACSELVARLDWETLGPPYMERLHTPIITAA